MIRQNLRTAKKNCTDLSHNSKIPHGIVFIHGHVLLQKFTVEKCITTKHPAAKSSRALQNATHLQQLVAAFMLPLENFGTVAPQRMGLTVKSFGYRRKYLFDIQQPLKIWHGVCSISPLKTEMPHQLCACSSDGNSCVHGIGLWSEHLCSFFCDTIF